MNSSLSTNMADCLHKQKQIRKAILACLIYFDIFKHPLSKKEIHTFLKLEGNKQQLEEGIRQLIDQQRIYKIDKYYALYPQINLLENRKKYEERATQFFPLAIKNGNLIRKFPFIKAVFISGSLSKFVLKEDGDIDYFIIAKKNRIWLAKLILKLYKFLFLKNSKDYFCINYFIADEHLKIKEQNTFTATELATLLPLGSERWYNKLQDANPWVQSYLPNFKHLKKIESQEVINIPTFTKILERVLNGRLGLYLDNLARVLHQFWNKRKYRNLVKEKDYELMLRSTTDEIKVHPPNHQGNTLVSYHNRLKELSLNFTEKDDC